MREALTQILYTRYTVLFEEHRLDTAESGMAWSFQHDDASTKDACNAAGRFSQTISEVS